MLIRLRDALTHEYMLVGPLNATATKSHAQTMPACVALLPSCTRHELREQRSQRKPGAHVHVCILGY